MFCEFELSQVVIVLYQGKKDLVRMDVEDEDGYDSVDEMLNVGFQLVELEDDSDFDFELDRRR